MSDNVATFQTLTQRPATEIVEHLEGLLEKARAGEIRAIAYVYVTPGSFVTTGWKRAEEDYFHALNSGCLLLSHAFASSVGDPSD